MAAEPCGATRVDASEGAGAGTGGNGRRCGLRLDVVFHLLKLAGIIGQFLLRVLFALLGLLE